MTQEEKSVYSVYFGKSAVTRHWPGSRNIQFLKQLSSLQFCFPDVQNKGDLQPQCQGHLSSKCPPLDIQRQLVVIGEVEPTLPDGNQVPSSCKLLQTLELKIAKLVCKPRMATDRWEDTTLQHTVAKLIHNLTAFWPTRPTLRVAKVRNAATKLFF